VEKNLVGSQILNAAVFVVVVVLGFFVFVFQEKTSFLLVSFSQFHFKKTSGGNFVKGSLSRF
jgi:hypothetical protein